MITRLLPVCLLTAWQEAWQYWQLLLDAVDKPAAKKLIPQLDMTNPLGIKHSLGQKRGAKYSKAPLYPFFLETKQKHPTKVLLVRVSNNFFLLSQRVNRVAAHGKLSNKTIV